MKCFGNCLGLKILEISGKTERFTIPVSICRNGKAQLIRYSIKHGRKEKAYAESICLFFCHKLYIQSGKINKEPRIYMDRNIIRKDIICRIVILEIIYSDQISFVVYYPVFLYSCGLVFKKLCIIIHWAAAW